MQKFDGLTQAEAAAFMQVDRTTIRAWQEAGMPYQKPEGRGKEGAYRVPVLMHWQLWIAFNKNSRIDEVIPQKLSPARAIAHVHAVTSSGASWEGEQVFSKQVHRILAGYYPRDEIDQAIGYALALTAEDRAA